MLLLELVVVPLAIAFAFVVFMGPVNCILYILRTPEDIEAEKKYPPSAGEQGGPW